MHVFSALALALTSPAFADEVVPPEVLTRLEATLPSGGESPLQDHVVLEFTIPLDGKPKDILVVESAGPAFDAAATAALQAWTFRPARHQGLDVVARTRLQFNLPLPAPPDAGVEADTDAGEFPHAKHEYSTTVTGRLVPKSRGASDIHVEVGELKIVPRESAGEFLKLAPGILLTNEGGVGHPDQIFLRGFDAREGQDIEFSVDGVPLNDTGNLHGNGYTDSHFIIPELIESLRVVEGPFDPRQGNFAVAGSADYELGLPERGVHIKGSYGSFNASRLAFLWGPPGSSSRTFAGAQIFHTDGFGQNRDALNGSAMAQYEGTLSESTSFRIAGQVYSAKWHSAGLLRDDDFRAGRKGFFDTYDDRQGGESIRASLYGDLTSHGGPFLQRHQFFVVFRDSRLRENFTGFLHDGQLLQQNPHPQRGDLLDRSNTAGTFGVKGFGRYRATVFERPQDLEVGYFARVDLVAGQQYALAAGSNVPYRRELDLSSRLADVGLYADVNFSPLWWFTLRGGVRVEALTYQVQDACAVQTVRRPSSSNPPGDESCLSQMDLGRYREPVEWHSAMGLAAMPRAVLLLGPFQDFTLNGAFGDGVRSVDPQYVTQDLATPFSRIRAWEGGVTYALVREPVDFSARGVFFGTRVDKDLVFSEQAGRNVIGGSTTRLGGLVAARVRGAFFDVQAHATYVQSKFDDTGLLVPYVPNLVMRLDSAVFGNLVAQLFGAPLKGSIGAGVTFVGQRPLPFGQSSDVIFTVDAQGELRWRWFSIGLAATNLFDRRYRLSEFNYASDFRTNGDLPTLVPARHFSAGAPRSLSITLGLHLGTDS